MNNEQKRVEIKIYSDKGYGRRNKETRALNTMNTTNSIPFIRSMSSTYSTHYTLHLLIILTRAKDSDSPGPALWLKINIVSNEC